MPRLFISSVWSSNYVPLADLRLQLWETARGLQLNGEPWTAWIDWKDERLKGMADAKPICLEEVEKSDLYVGLFAERYGRTRYDYRGHLLKVGNEEEESNLALTELELHHAVAEGKAIRLYIFKGEFEPSPGLRTLLDIIIEDQVLRNRHICWTTENDLLDDFRRDLERPDCLDIYRVSSLYMDALLLKDLDENFEKTWRFLSWDNKFQNFTGFDLNYVEEKIKEMERFYSLKLYQDCIRSGISVFLHLPKIPPSEYKYKEFIPLWIRFLGRWKKATNWMGLDKNPLLDGLSTAKLLREFYQRTGKNEDLFEFYWVDGAIANTLHNLGSLPDGRIIKPSFFQDALKRIERALQKAVDPAHSQLEAGFLDIKASICSKIGPQYQEDAYNAIKESLNIREKNPQFPEDSLGNTLIKFGRLARDRRKIEVGISICSLNCHPGFEVGGHLALAELLIENKDIEGAREELRKGLDLAKKYHLIRFDRKVLSLSRRIQAEIK